MAVPGLNAAQVNPYASHSRTGNRVVFTCTGSHRVRITVYKPEMARIEFSSNGDFLDGESGFYLLRASFNEKTYPAVTFSVTDQGTYVAIQTSSMTIRVQKNPLRVQYYDATNTTLITKDSDARGMDTENPRLRLVRNVGEHFFGWGGGRDIMQGNLPAQLDKTGLRIGQNLTTNFDIKWCNDAPFLFSTDGYAVFFLNTEHPYSGVAGVDISQPGQVDYIGDYADVGTILRYYFFYGPYARCIDNYTELTGRPPNSRKSSTASITSGGVALTSAGRGARIPRGRTTGVRTSFLVMLSVWTSCTSGAESATPRATAIPMVSAIPTLGLSACSSTSSSGVSSWGDR